MIEVRNAVEQDVGAILELLKAKAEFDGCLESFKASENDIHEAFFCPPPKARAIVAVKSGEVVGIATFYEIYSTFIAKRGFWLDDLFVYQAHRQDGIGKALLSALCRIAKREDCKRIDWVVARANENGRGFYNSLGANIFEGMMQARFNEHAIDELAINNA